MMNHEPESGFSPEDAPAFRRLRDRRLARRRRVLRIVLLVTLSAALLAGAAFYAHRQLIKPYLDTPITAPETAETPAEPISGLPLPLEALDMMLPPMRPPTVEMANATRPSRMIFRV